MTSHKDISVFACDNCPFFTDVQPDPNEGWCDAFGWFGEIYRCTEGHDTSQSRPDWCPLPITITPENLGDLK